MQVQPRKCPLDYPSARQHNEAFCFITAQDHLQQKAKPFSDPVCPRTTIAAINPDSAQLFATSCQSRKQQTSAIALWQTGDGDRYHKQQTQRINQDMTLPAL